MDQDGDGTDEEEILIYFWENKYKRRVNSNKMSKIECHKNIAKKLQKRGFKLRSPQAIGTT